MKDLLQTIDLSYNEEEEEEEGRGGSDVSFLLLEDSFFSSF